MKKEKRILIAVTAALVVILVAVAAYLIQKNTPSRKKMALTDYFKVAEGQIQIILEDTIYDTPGIYEDGKVYVDINLVKDQLNKRFYWDSNENLLLYTTSTAVISTKMNSQDVYSNKSREMKDYTVVRVEGDAVYVALDFVKEYTALEYEKFDEPDRVVIRNQYNVSVSYAKTKDTAKLRVKPHIKSDILVDLKKEEAVRILEKEDKETGFCKVMTGSGVAGYVRAKELGDLYDETATTSFQEEKYSHILKEKKVNLVWHQVTNQTANGKLSQLLESAEGVNVVAPTWFATSDNNGNITSLASYSYVESAHRAGVEVWALCDDFSPDMKIGKVLGSTSTRQKLEKNLLAEAIRYSLDGINIDFENVKKESADDFIQFVRELGIMCRNNGIVLSIDNYPPKEYSQYYNRTEQAAVADYVITMAYDEYYAGSEEAGPVSSISYVKDSITGTLEQVPAEQTIIALPFYSRHWTEKTKDGKVKLSSEACSMSAAQEVVQDSGKDAVWDDTVGMNYLEYTAGKAVHKIWVEDARSLELKMQEVAAAETGGVAFWKLGLEKSSVWDMIGKYIH